MGLVHKITMFGDNIFIVGGTIENASFHWGPLLRTGCISKSFWFSGS